MPKTWHGHILPVRHGTTAHAKKLPSPRGRSMRGPVGSAVDDRIVAESMSVLGPSTWFKI